MKLLAQFIPSSLIASVSFVNGLDITLRVLSFGIALFLAWLQWRAYKSRKRVDDAKLKQLNEDS